MLIGFFPLGTGDDHGVHALSTPIISSQNNRTGWEGLVIQLQCGVSCGQGHARVSKAVHPGWFVGESDAMPRINGHWLIDDEAQKGIPCGIFVIIGCLNIGRAGQNFWNIRECIGAVNIYLLSILQDLFWYC